ncbi:hypothetical protein [Stenotrophomonas bentonitica]|uniref:hypothetical protein n=1 Tax=Stenotrophomonas bentonitica TaxID=1450134 RepID=UPI00345EAF3C
MDWPITEGFHCWVGLNSSVDRDWLDVNPFVGIHVVPIMKFYTTLEGRKYARNVATYAAHLGTLKPDVAVFWFSKDRDNSAEFDRMASLYRDSGLDFAISVSTFDLLLPLLKKRVTSLGGYPERYASCLHLMGRTKESISFVESFSNSEPDYFREFSRRYLDKYG